MRLAFLLITGCCLLTFTYTPSVTRAQSLSFDFKHITRDHGLSQSNVTCIIEDKKGFMWFGTRDGLNKYDGYNITVYRHDPLDSTSISHNYIHSLYEDNEGNLWIGTEDGLNVYQSRKDGFTIVRSIVVDNSHLSNKIKAIFQDLSGNLWIGTAKGLGRLQSGNLLSGRFAIHDALGNVEIEDIAGDAQGNIMVATWNDGMYVIENTTGNVKHFTFDNGDPQSIGSNFLKKLFVDSRGKAWIGTTKGGLNLFHKANGTFTRYQQTQQNGLTNNDVLAISEDHLGRLWIGTQNGGINLFDRQTNTFSYIPESEKEVKGLTSGSVYSIYRDRNGNMWVGTFSGGVNYWLKNHEKFALLTKTDRLPTLNNSNVLCVTDDDAGNILIGTDGGGINLYNTKNNSVEYLTLEAAPKSNVKSNYPLCFYQDSEGMIWIGSFYGQVSIYDPTKKTLRHLSLGADVDHVSAISEDSQGRLWFGTWGQGLVVYNKDEHSFRRYTPTSSPRSVSHQIIFSLLRDREGNMWVGTEGGGLNLYDAVKDEFISFKAGTVTETISNNIVNCIYQSTTGDLWIGTNGGLNRFEPSRKRFTTFTARNGMASEVVQAILEDGSGNLWLSTNKGLSRFDTQKNTFRNYLASDGLQGNAFNRMSAFKNKKGEMYFGGIEGLNIFHPDSIEDNHVLPPVYFTELQIFNKPVRVGEKGSPLEVPLAESDQLTLSYKHSVFSLEFVAINYTFPEKNQYAYKLQGFDHDWNFIGTQRKATYTNLHPGNYVLRVKASNNDGVWNEQGATMRITIVPPFWQTWWSKTFYLLVIVALVITLRKVLLHRMEVRNRLEMDEMKLRFYANISHEFRTPLTLILGPLNELRNGSPLTDSHSRLIDLMHRNGQRLHKLINQLMHIYELDAGFTKLKVSKGDLVSFCRALKDTFSYPADKKNISYRFEADTSDAECYFDHDKLEKILLNILSNAFKYTSNGGTITMHLSVQDISKFGSLMPFRLRRRKNVSLMACISIADDGIGIPAAAQEKVFDRFYRVENKDEAREGTGIGLSLARQLAESHHGDIVLESESGKGSTFTIWLPVNRSAYSDIEIVEVPNASVESALNRPPLEELVNGHSTTLASPAEPCLPLLLIVEDSNDIRLYLKHNLSSLFRIEEAQNGKEGMKRTFELIPDVIISDVMMPEMDGIEMLSTLKRDIRTSHIPSILLTARANEKFQINAFEHSLADDYITKPFNAQILVAKIRNMMTLRENVRRRLQMEFLANPSTPSIPEIDEIFLKKGVEVVERYMEDCDFSVERFSREMAMSQTNLYRKLQSLLGISTNQFIKEVRMKRAAQLIESGQFTITEVAYRVGFSDPKYFSQVFKKHFRVLPTAFSAITRDQFPTTRT